jgi:hypothetical protein
MRPFRALYYSSTSRPWKMRFLITLLYVAGVDYCVGFCFFGILFLILLFPISSWGMLVAVLNG